MTSNLRHLRKIVGLSQLELANRARINQAVISSFERGRTQLSDPQLARLQSAVIEVIQSKAETLTRIARVLDDGE